LRSPHFDNPQLFIVKGQELPLSGQSLLELMQAVLARGAPFRFRARGWSMAPFIRDGDVITITPLKQTRPGLGEVVAFIRPDVQKLVVHRIVARRGRTTLIQGDSVAECSDGLIPVEDLLGRVTRVERNGRRVLIGLGPERYLIAGLSRTRLLIPLSHTFRNLVKMIFLEV
jgi:hypothetical protein